MQQNLWPTLVTHLAYGVDRELWKAIEGLREQVRVLKQQQEKDKRIRLNNQQRRTHKPKRPSSQDSSRDSFGRSPTERSQYRNGHREAWKFLPRNDDQFYTWSLMGIGLLDSSSLTSVS